MSKIKSTDLWRTPNTAAHPVICLCEEVFGGKIDLDPTADAAKSIPATQHITEADNFLVQRPRAESAYMNPPFSNPLPFVEHLSTLYLEYQIDEAIALLKSGTVHNKGTGSVIWDSADAICFWGAGKRSRIGFLDAEGTPIARADFDCALIYWGAEPEWFCSVFGEYGAVIRAWRSQQAHRDRREAA
jgi:hypothetical protein